MNYVSVGSFGWLELGVSVDRASTQRANQNRSFSGACSRRRGSVAVVAVVALAAVNYRGVTRTAQLTRIIVVLVLATIAVVVAATASRGLPLLADLDTSSLIAHGPYALLQ